MIPHGYSRYSNNQCRCDICRAAWSAYQMTLRKTRRKRLARDPDLAPHGDPNTYTNWGCRCVECRSAHNRCRNT